MHPKLSLLLLAFVLGIGGSGATPVLDLGGVGPQAPVRWRSEAAACVIEPAVPAVDGRHPGLHTAPAPRHGTHPAPPSDAGHGAPAASLIHGGSSGVAVGLHAGHDRTPVADTAHPAHEGCVPTPEEQQRADALVAATRRVLTTRFANPQQAIVAGYRPISDTLARRVHYVSKEERANPRVLDPEHPEGMIYQRGPKGIEVIGAWYIMPKVTDTGPQIGGCLTVWHRHTGEDGRVSPEMLHVWIVDTVGGPFAHSTESPASR